MTGLDLTVAGILAVSSIAGLMRGLTREVFSLGAWMLAFVLAKALAPVLAPLVPGLESEALRHFAAIVLVFVVTVIAAGLAGAMLAGMVKWVGLGFYDRFMGLVFGALRGGVIVLFLALLAGLTALPRTGLWQASASHALLEAMARAAVPWLPASLAEHIHY